MRLEEYLEERGISKTEFSRRCKISISTIFNIMRSKNIRLDVAMKIVNYTEGKVRPEDLLPKKQEKSVKKKK